MPIEAGKKKRYTISPERYIVHGHEGHAYIIMAKDGSVKTVPRWRLKPSDDEKYPLAETIGKGNAGIVKKILAMKKGMYRVKWKVPLGQPKQITWEYPSNIRRVNDDLSEMTPEEERFFKGRTVKEHLSLKYTEKDVESLDGMLDDGAVDALLIHDFDDSGNNAYMRADLTSMVLWHDYLETDLVGQDDWLLVETLYMPAIVNGNHWVLVTVEFDRTEAEPKATVNIYDSKKTPIGRPQLEAAMRKFLANVPDVNHVEIKYIKSAQQKKTDGLSCGVFMVENALALFRGDPIPKALTNDQIRDLRIKYRRQLTEWETEGVRQTSASPPESSPPP
jgi:hypothetical protein